MKKLSIAICDEQETYRQRLSHYFIRKKGNYLQIFTFSNRRSFWESRGCHTFDIVLLGRGFLDLAENPKVGELAIRMVEERPGETGEPTIFKYQSADTILREMYEYYLKMGKKDPYISRKRKQVVGVYSPSHSKLQTPFALSLAQLFSNEKKCLYVNLGEWNSVEEWFRQRDERDLGDLLYYLSCYGGNAGGVLESVVHSVDKLDYIPPMGDPQLLCQTEGREYVRMLRFLTERTDYDVIFLDFGVMVPGFYEMLENCNRIFLVQEQGELSRQICRRFQENLERHGRNEIIEKLQTVSFSADEEQRVEEETALHQWIYGKVGDRARVARSQVYGTN